MSRGYSRIHNRKLSAASHASIQFDKLLNENSNRPTASKSSGTLGKWGVISCTSLRSTNPKGRREEALGVKKKRADYSNRNAKLATPPEDPFSFDVDPGSVQGKLAAAASPAKPVIKPKKFFKSRNVDSGAAAAVPDFPGSNRSAGAATYGGKKYSKETPPTPEPAVAVSKKFFTSKKAAAAAAAVENPVEQVEAMNLSSPTKSPSPSTTEHKPPIVLRIFKGTSHLVGDETEKKTTTTHLSSARQSSSSDGSGSSVIVRSTRSTRSNKNYSEIDDDDSLVTPSYETRKSTSMSPNSITELPKKTRKSKGSSSSYEDIVRLATDTSSSSIDNRENVTGKKTRQAAPKVAAVLEVINEAMDVDNIQDTLTASQDTYVASQDTGIGSLPLSLDTSTSTIREGMSAPSSQTMTVDTDPNETVPDDTATAAADEDKLLKADELLASTYVDFNTAAEKLLMPQVKGMPEAVAPAKAEWFSDSEDSSSLNDQIPTASTSNTDAAVGKDDLELALKLQAEQLAAAAADAVPVAAAERRNSPATKKGSIFKSRSLLSGGNKKRLALYKHKWSDNDKPPGGTTAAQPSSSQPPNVYSELDAEFVTTKLTRVTSWPMTEADNLDLDEAEAITSVKCTKKAKGFYTVVRNVQKAHQIQESGEFQEFNDDVEYILDALQDTYPIGTRCLSAITLASKCMAPAFRMHVRAHGTVAKFFRALHDATKDQSLGLCTATVMFVLSQDRLNMDLDRHSLELMLNLLESDVSHRHALDDCGLTDRQLHKNKQKVRELCAEIQSQGHAKHLNLDNITVGHLAMETLLSLTSRRAGEWFKEELRELGGLEHIVKTVCECCRQVDDYVVEWTDPLLDKLRKVDRCLRVLENVTYQNEENQLYLLRYGDGILLDTLVKLFRQCDSEMPLYPVTDPLDKDSTGTVIREVLLATLKVLINLTHDFNNKSFGSALAGERKGIIDANLHLLLQVADYVPEEKKFDMLVLALIMLINLVEHCQPNRKLLFEAKAPPDPENVFHSNDKSAVQALIALFQQQEEHARTEEMKTDAILDGKKDTDQPEAATEKPKTQEEFIEETVAKLLQKAGRNMEHTLISAYVGLLLGFLIIDNRDFELAVREALPEKQFTTMIAVLQKVFNFMNLTSSAGGMARGIAQIERVINFMTKSDKLAAELNDPNSATNKDESMDDSFS